MLELLAPAGDWECMEAAITFGADAVYLGGLSYGMRASSATFDYDRLKKAVDYAHKLRRKIYLTCNTLPRNQEIDHFPDFVQQVVACGVDAFIVTDLGILSLIKKYASQISVHISTQAGIVNYEAARAFYEMGAQRVVLARELSLDEIAEIRAKTPGNLELEAFVHGAMCVSFSGRCLLSNYLVNRDANRGECAQPCRWGYHLMEEKRPQQFFPVFEDSTGTYILNSKDLCMLPHLDQLAKVGVSSFKIEGRAKSSYYVSTITNAYRIGLDLLKEHSDSYPLPDWVKEEVYKVSHRDYCTGFYFGHPNDCQYYQNGGYIRNYDVVAIVTRWENGRLYAMQRNKFCVGDVVEILSPNGQEPVSFKIAELFDENGVQISTANHAAVPVSVSYPMPLPPGSILRMQRK